ncbi:MAG: MutS-related protein [Rectinema subterraneum]|uniref:MutS-related protein n=1 Tax=Rectinema subterraneum TaxID=2653714 RepID=UPI003C7A842E
MIAVSVLYENPGDSRRTAACQIPDYFVDLNLDQIVDSINGGLSEYNLQSIFYRYLSSASEVQFRQAIMRDMEKLDFLAQIKAFSSRFRAMRRSLASLEKLYNLHHRQGWFLEAVAAYCESVESLTGTLRDAELGSVGLRSLRDYLIAYASSESFLTLKSEMEGLLQSLGEIHYSIIIKNLTVRVKKFENEIDYSADIDDTFSRFRQGATKSYLLKMPSSIGLNHVEAQILDCVAKLYPEIFASLDAFCKAHASFIDETIDTFEREIQFYISYLDYIGPLRRAGLSFCYPEIAESDKNTYAQGFFDLALAEKVAMTSTRVVPNDFNLQGKERMIVITGPNQGGKTTFVRAFGQLHHLAAIGLPVPGTGARLFLYDAIFTHFEREETIKSQRGKLHDEIIRIHNSLERATPSSIFILNEIFTSTTVKDSLFLSRKVLEKILALEAIAVCVTFLDELASMDDRIVSMVSCVDPQDPSIRTFKVERRPADGLAYARSIAEKYHLTYESLKNRLEQADGGDHRSGIAGDDQIAPVGEALS